MTEEAMEGEYEMNNGSIGATDAATLALLADTARAGRGHGYYGGGEGGGYGSFGPFASTSSIQHGIDGVGQKVEDQADCTRTTLGIQAGSIEKSLENLERNNSFNRLCDRVSNVESSLTKAISDAEFRSLDRMRDIERDITANAAKAAEC